MPAYRRLSCFVALQLGYISSLYSLGSASSEPCRNLKVKFHTFFLHFTRNQQLIVAMCSSTKGKNKNATISLQAVCVYLFVRSVKQAAPATPLLELQ